MALERACKPTSVPMTNALMRKEQLRAQFEECTLQHSSLAHVTHTHLESRHDHRTYVSFDSHTS